MIKERSIYRIIDANANRTKEGLRVCEDIARFLLNDKKSSLAYKTLRHQLERSIKDLPVTKKALIQARDIGGDVGAGSLISEMKRSTVKEVFLANSQRVKESVRVLEEFSKLIQERTARRFKASRYQIYALEKIIVKKL